MTIPENPYVEEQNPAYEPAPEGVWVVKVTTWHRLPKELIGVDHQQEVADWIVEEYLGPAGLMADWEPVYAKLQVHDKENPFGDYQLVPVHWRAPLGNDGGDHADL